MKVLAPAKINVSLTVGPRRADGYHELMSVMQAVSLYDELVIEDADEWQLTVEPDGAAPTGEDNLVMRAARAFEALQGAGRPAHLALQKAIPMAAGLAGGSADAAATLVGLNALWDAGVSRKALEKIGATLGSDVPFCVRGGTAVVRGAGEDLAELASTTTWWVLGMSDVALSTREVYARFDEMGEPELGDPFEVADALARGDVDRLGQAMRNDLEQAALSLSPGVSEGRQAMEDAGAVRAMLTGSGPTWLGLAWNEGHAEDIARGCADAFARVEVVRSLNHGPRPVRSK